MAKIALKNFTTLNPQESALVLEWRNHPKVASFMRTASISLEEHLIFLERLKCDSTKAYFLVFKDMIPIGVIDFVHITQESCEFGLYQSPYLKGFGKILMQEVLRYAFNVLRVQVLRACVFKNNPKALELYLKFGFNITKEDQTMYILQILNIFHTI